MLMRARPMRQRGFSLVELMVALVVGLIVIGAVLALIMSIIRSNNQTIAATRLTQELRATMAVVAADIKRAGGVDDPLTAATAAAGTNPFATINSATAGCLRYGYANAADGSFHAISLSNGAVFMDTGATAGDATCGGGLRLSTDAVNVDTLTFTVNGRRIEVTLGGSLDSDPEIQRTLSQTVFVRSVAGT